MRSFVLACMYLFAALSATLSGARAQEAAAPCDAGVCDTAKLEAFADGVVRAHMRAHQTPGVIVSIVRDGQIVMARGYGIAGRDPEVMTSGDETLFRMGSVSKTFVWTAAMMLAEQGGLDLDADINSYLDGIEVPEAFGAPVTMNHLMAHSAGFEDTFAIFMHEDDEVILDTDVLVRDMPARVFAPGARISYSNYGTALAAKVVENVVGVPYETFLHEEILLPLGMNRTVLRGPSEMAEALKPDLSKAFRVRNGEAEEIDYMQIGAYAPVGAMGSTASDMARWMQFHLGHGSIDGVTLMRPESHEAFWTRAQTNSDYGTAHGFMRTSYRGVELYGHGGATAGFFSNMTMVPELGLGIYVSQNAANDRILVTDLDRLVIDHVLGPQQLPVRVSAEESAETLADYAGTYLLNRRSFTKFDKLFASDSIAEIVPRDDGALMITRSGETAAFYPVENEPETFVDGKGGRIIFGRNETGDVTFLLGSMGVHTFEKVSGLGNPALLYAGLGGAILFAATTFLGLWRRLGRDVPVAPAGRMVSLVALASAVLVLSLAGCAVWLMISLAEITAADFINYPPIAITVFRMIALVLFVASVVMVLSLWPAWVGSGFSIWRKMHHTLFAAVLVLMAVMMVEWNIVFAPLL